MVASGRVAYLARRGADYGVHTGDIRIDMETRPPAQARYREELSQRQPGDASKRPPTLELIFGEASFTGAKSVCRPPERRRPAHPHRRRNFHQRRRASRRVPRLDGLEDVPFLDSTSIMELDAVPEHLLVLGGGYVGLEFGQMFRRFGSRVTIVQSGGQLLDREDPDVARRSRHHSAAGRQSRSC